MYVFILQIELMCSFYMNWCVHFIWILIKAIFFHCKTSYFRKLEHVFIFELSYIRNLTLNMLGLTHLKRNTFTRKPHICICSFYILYFWNLYSSSPPSCFNLHVMNWSVLWIILLCHCCLSHKMRICPLLLWLLSQTKSQLCLSFPVCLFL